MIIFFADGRLGNQIFQYAFLTSIAKNNEIIIGFNMGYLCSTFELNNKFKALTLRKYSNFFFRKVFKPYFLHLFVKLKIIGYVKQNRSGYIALPSFVRVKGLLGITLVESNFFQSERFFDSKTFSIYIRPVFVNCAKHIMASFPAECVKVFVHIRRGDYLTEKYLNKEGIELPLCYYRNAIAKIVNEIEKPFFVFLSDDPLFVESNFADIGNKYISKNSMQVDFALMQLCECGIVSNSSFSWWGAYLMKHRNKVIFPKYWYGWKSLVESHEGIQPDWAEVIDVTE